MSTLVLLSMGRVLIYKVSFVLVTQLQKQPFHTLIGSVFGYNYVRIYFPSEIEKLYPYKTQFQKNLSQISNPQSPTMEDKEKFPLFADAKYQVRQLRGKLMCNPHQLVTRKESCGPANYCIYPKYASASILSPFWLISVWVLCRITGSVVKLYHTVLIYTFGFIIKLELERK